MDVQMLAQYGPGGDVGFIPSMDGLAPGFGVDVSFFEAANAPCAIVDNYVLVLQNNQDASPPKPLPKVLSLSWGWASEQGNLAIAAQYKGFNSEGEYCEESFAKLTSMGVHVLASSGDQGAVNNFGACNVLDAVGTSVLAPSYPGSSPYVTSVGAIMDVRMAEGEDPVLAACMGPSGAGFTSGGGFSNMYGRPEWQEEAVSEYLGKDHSGYKYYPGQGQTGFAPSGRGYPDVSFYGYNIPIIDDGDIEVSGGTSASAPMFGGLLLQLIARLEESGVCGDRDITLVQLNRFLYKAAKTHPAAFIDVVHGNIAWSGQRPEQARINCGVGYEATEGWDPASGLGTINMPEFVQAAIDMADEFFCDG
jgi:tripeptidyl-peptidase-1